MRPTMLRKALIVPALITMLYQPPAQAVIGIGDISFDPTVYAELVSIYSQGVEIWNTAKKQLDSLAEVQRTIKQANQAYQSIVNIDLKRIASDLTTGDLNGSDDQIAALRSEMSQVESTLGGNTRYYQYQSQRIKNLESLELLQKASTNNLERASGNMGEAVVPTSTQITAQSTSTLAALAAAEEQRRVNEDVARNRAQAQEVDSVKQSADIYRVIGDMSRPLSGGAHR